MIKIASNSPFTIVVRSLTLVVAATAAMTLSSPQSLASETLKTSVNALMSRLFQQLSSENPDVNEAQLETEVRAYELTVYKMAAALAIELQPLSPDAIDERLELLEMELQKTLSEMQNPNIDVSYAQIDEYLLKLTQIYIVSAIATPSQYSIEGLWRLRHYAIFVAGLSMQTIAGAGSLVLDLDPPTAIPLLASGFAVTLYGALSDTFTKKSPEKRHPLLEKLMRRFFADKILVQKLEQRRQSAATFDDENRPLLPSLWSRAELHRKGSDLTSKESMRSATAHYYLEVFRELSEVSLRETIVLNCASALNRTRGNLFSKP